MIADLITMTVSFGLGMIDENLEKLLDAMKNVPISLSLIGTARSIALCIALGVGAYETWMMMLGRRGMDVMKILRIIIISLCITYSNSLAAALRAPGDNLKLEAQAVHHTAYADVLAKEKKCADLQQEYVKKIQEAVDSARSKERGSEFLSFSGAQDVIETIETGGINKVADFIGNEINSWVKQGAVAMESYIIEAVCFLIRFLGEVVFQMMYYGLLVVQQIALYLLTAFMPIAFAMSLAPPYKSAWSQFISKFLTISLWGFVIYIAMFFVDHILQFYISLDIASYTKLTNQPADGSWSSVASLGIQGIGQTCQYVIGMLLGAKVLSMVPDMASWLIPGGVSSSAGSAMSGVAMGAVAGAAGTAMAAGSAATGIAVSAPGTVISGASAYGAAHSSGATPTAALTHAIFSQTGWGHRAAEGSRQPNTFGNWGKKK